MTTTQRVVVDGHNVAACPECDSASVFKRDGSGIPVVGDRAHNFVCYRCSESFDNFIERPPRKNSDEHRRNIGASNLSDLGQALLDADPDEISLGGDE